MTKEPFLKAPKGMKQGFYTMFLLFIYMLLRPSILPFKTLYKEKTAMAMQSILLTRIRLILKL